MKEVDLFDILSRGFMASSSCFPGGTLLPLNADKLCALKMELQKNGSRNEGKAYTSLIHTQSRTLE